MATFDGVLETPLQYWLGTDKTYEFTIYASLPVAGVSDGTIRDVTGYTTSFMVKRHVGDADGSALLTVAGTVSGVFNATPSANTQKISVAIADDLTDTEIAPGVAQWSLKRTDAGAESVLAYGTIQLRRAVHVA